MTMGWLCVSYKRDYPWLTYLSKSFRLHARGFDEFVLAVPTQDYDAIPQDLEFTDVITFDDKPGFDPHIRHCEIKLMADECCKSDLIAFIDSDCVLQKATTPDLFLNEFGRVINLKRLFGVKDGKIWPSHWQAGTIRALGEPVEHETMARHPFVGWRKSFANLRAHMERVHGKSLHEYLRPIKKGEFSEFCTIGAYCSAHEPGYYFMDADDPKREASDVIWQFWSWHKGGVNHPDVQAKLKDLDLL